MKKIWIDADACPAVIKDVLYKAAEKRRITTILVANSYIKTPRSTYIEFVKVQSGLDVADNEIVRQLGTGDIVITADIPLAANVVAKGGLALNPRGEIYTDENIRERLSARDFMDVLRSSGVETGGPAAFSAKDKQSFANALDRLLSKF